MSPTRSPLAGERRTAARTRARRRRAAREARQGENISSRQPLRHGTDIVVYSATKHIDGQGRTLGGLVLGTKKFCTETLLPFVRNTGPALSPFNAWVLLKGMETLQLRLRHQSASALELATSLSASAAVDQVFYPALNPTPLYNKQMSGGGKK